MNESGLVKRIKELEEKERILDEIFKDENKVTVYNSGYKVYPKTKYLLEWMHLVNDLTLSQDKSRIKICELNRKIEELSTNNILNNSLYCLFKLWLKNKRIK